MTVWRAKINSAMASIEGWKWDEAKEYCRRASVVGVGWGRPEWLGLPVGATLDEMLTAIAANPDPNWKSGRSTVRRLAEDMSPGDLVWTRDSSGDYWLGRIGEGGWRYDASEEASQWDLNNVQPCEWLDQPMRDFEVPGAVVNSFTGRSSSLCRVDPHHQGGWRMTELIYERAIDPNFEWSPPSLEDVVGELLDPIDIEDIALLYLQSRGWMLLPSSRLNDTPLYEAALRHLEDGQIAVVAVKSGTANPVPVSQVVKAVPGAKVFVCSNHDLYSEDPAGLGAIPIRKQDLVEFISSKPDLMPPRISNWLSDGDRLAPR